MKYLLLALFVASMSPIASADETWSSFQMGDIIYESDHGNVAVLSFAGAHPGSRAHLYVVGMGGNITNRGTFSGYWIESAPGECASERTGADGLVSNMWGLAEVEFDDANAPSGFVGRLGSCDGEFTEEFRAEVAAAGFTAAPGDMVMPNGDGIVLSRRDRSASVLIPFGAPYDSSLLALNTALGSDYVINQPEECPAGPVTVVSYAHQLDVVYAEDQLVGWIFPHDSILGATEGIAIGTLLSTLESKFGVEIFESSLGQEFQAGGMSGVLSEQTRAIEALWSGTVCIFR